MTNSLFEETEIIQSINYDQHEILLDIMKLYCPEGFELDPTYCRGGFYVHSGIPRPNYCFDINPVLPECHKADCRQLPLSDRSIKSAIFDPPFFATTQRSGKNGRMCVKYGYFESMVELKCLYWDSLVELHRVLVPQGILIFKCQDSVHGRQNYWSHCFVLQAAEKIGFRAEDLFIKLNKSAATPWNMEVQQHARKMHSYFWVLRKKGRP